MAIEVSMNRERVIFLGGICLFFGAMGVKAQEATQQLPKTVVEEAVAPLYRNQANVAQSKMMNDRELAVATRNARIEKELKAAIAAQGMSARPPVITTAAQFLEANKPSPAPPSDTPRPEPNRGGDYVPPFLTPEDPTANSNSRVKPDNGPSAENAMNQATAGDFEMPKQKGGFFSKLFGKKKAVDPSGDILSPLSEYPTESVGEMAPEPAAEAPQLGAFGIPDAPGINDSPAPQMAPTPPAPQPVGSSGASIFKGKKTAASSGTKLTVVSDVDATVSGVLVKLFKGDQVEMLGQTGALANIRLRDQRVGTVPASALQ